MKKIILTLSIGLIFNITFSQEKFQDLYSRVHIIESEGTSFYNLDGIDLKSQNIDKEFNEKNIIKSLKIFNFDKKQTLLSDSNLSFENKYVINKKNECIYFLKNNENKILAINFWEFETDKTAYYHRLIEMIIDNNIPDICVSQLNTRKVNFSGRTISLGGNCQFLSNNNIQCPYNGQISWSVFKNAKKVNEYLNKYINYSKSQFKNYDEESVELLFENKKTTAQKIVYKTGDITSKLVYAKTLTVYYINQNVRGNQIGCVMSHWNNDVITNRGFTWLMEEFVKNIK